MEKFKTEKAHKVFMEGHVNMFGNSPLVRSKIFAYSPFLATAYDVPVPVKDGTASAGTMRLWRLGELHDTDCVGVEIGPDEKQLT